MYWHRINGAMKPSAGGCKIGCGFKNTSVCSGFGKNYIRVRMQYLWKFVWKFGAFAMLIVIGSMSFTQKISLVRVMEGVLLFLTGPMLIGYIELKESLFCR